MATKSDTPHAEKAQAKTSPLDRVLKTTRFEDCFANTKKEEPLSLRQFAAEINAETKARKDKLPLRKLGTFGDIASDANCLRTDANMLAVSGCEGDYDAEQVPMSRAADLCRAAGIACLFYESPSAAPGKHRWRVMAPFSKEYSPKARASFVARINGVLGGILTGESFYPVSQTYYFGKVGKTAARQTILVEGAFVDTRTDLDAGAAYAFAKAHEKHASTKPDPRDKHNFVGAFCRVFGIARLIEEVLSDKYEPGDTDDRYTYLLGSAKNAARCYGDVHFYSYHETDPANGPRTGLHNAFDLARIHLFGELDGTPVADSKPWLLPSYKAMIKKFEDHEEVAAEVKAGNIAEELDVVTRYNAKHAVVNFAGKTRILTQHDESEDFSTTRDFYDFHIEKKVWIDDTPVEEAKVWRNSKDVRKYERGVTFAPMHDTEPDRYNLFRGWAVAPDEDEEKCKLFLEHVRDVLASNNETSLRYIMGYFAHMIQCPDDKPGVALVFRSEEGSGKDIVGAYLGKIFPKHYQPVGRMEDLTGRFNANQAECLLHVEEAFWAGSKNDEGSLKHLLTAPQVAFERKGIDKFKIDSYLRFFISSNKDWVVKASEGARRWAVFEASEDRIGDRAYFNALISEMDGDGPAALLHYLQTYDLTDFDVRRIPMTDALATQKVESLENAWAFWHACLADGSIPLVAEGRGDLTEIPWTDEGCTVQSDQHHRGYVSWHGKPGRRGHGPLLGQLAFSREIKEVCPGKKHDQLERGAPWSTAYPPLDECRRDFEAKMHVPINWTDAEIDPSGLI